MPILFQSLKIITDKEILEPADYFFDSSSLQSAPTDLPMENMRIINCEGMLGSAGWIDLRCFAGEPGEEYRETIESLAEVLMQAGMTEAVLLPNTHPPIQSKNEVAYIQNKVKELFPTFHIQAAVTRNMRGEDLTEMLDLNHHGVNIFGEGLVPLSHSDRMMKALLYLQKCDGLLIDHSYDPLMALFGHMHEGIASTLMGMKGIPDIAEEAAVQKNLEILRYTGGRLHFQTISTKGAIDQIRKAKAEGLKVTADVSIYQLLFTDDALQEFETSLKVMPPFRGEAQQSALIEGLKDGTIDALVSNHIPYDMDAKNQEFDLAPFGMAGLQTFVPSVVQLEKKLGYPLLISKLTKGPARVLGKKLAEFETLTIFDPDAEWTLNTKNNRSLSQNSPYWSNILKGKVKYLINRGKLIDIDE
ncbi:MAG: dihydroorotase [Cyclobacteriaceae bacterium]